MEMCLYFCFKILKKCKLWLIIIILRKKCFYSLGCGIGYGYLYRIFIRLFEEGKKIFFSG